MSFREEYECDRCGSQVIESGAQQPRPLQIVLEKGDDPETYEAHDRILCSGCEEDLMVWIDEGEVDRSDQADLPHADRMAKTMVELGEELHDMADHLTEQNDTGPEDEDGVE